MRFVGATMLVCLALALLKAAVNVVAVLILGAIVISALVQPLKTLSAGGALISLGLIGQYPLAAVALLIAGSILRARSSET